MRVEAHQPFTNEPGDQSDAPPFVANDNKDILAYVYATTENTGEYECEELELKATATTTTGSYSAYKHGELMPVVSLSFRYYARGEFHAELRDKIIPRLPDDAARTARRILQLDAWIDGYDPLRPDDIGADVIGRYNPLRPEQNHLAVVTDSTVVGFQPLPFIITVGDTEDEDALKQRLDKIVDQRAIKQMDSMQEHFYRKRDESDRHKATEYTMCCTLEEAQRIIRGGQDTCDDVETTGDTPHHHDDEERRHDATTQATLTSY